MARLCSYSLVEFVAFALGGEVVDNGSNNGFDWVDWMTPDEEEMPDPLAVLATIVVDGSDVVVPEGIAGCSLDSTWGTLTSVLLLLLLITPGILLKN
jgi:hypothetical protein